MALKQDYILRMIEELINILVKTLKDENKDKEEEINSFDVNSDELYLYLKELVDNKKINDAENYLFDKLNENNKKDFVSGMAFYKYLNEKDDEFLENCDYSREEVLEGMADLSKKYGFGDFVEMFMKS